MVKINQKGAVLNAKIPTLVGVGVLVVGLIAGMVVLNQGSGIFLPRATEETTPKDVKITNLTERSFSVSFVTEAETTAFVKIVGMETADQKIKDVNLQAGDDRDQLRGTIASYPLHHITMTGLEADSNYYFVIGTDKGALYDDDGEKFVVKTAKRSTNAPNAKTIYGAVTNQSGGPAKGSIVYAQIEGAGEMSQLVQESGSWAIPLANARTKDGSAYASISETSKLSIFVQGYPLNLKSNLSTTIAEFKSGQTISLGETAQEAVTQNTQVDTESDQIDQASKTASLEKTVTPTAEPTVSIKPTVTTPPDVTATPTATLSPTPTDKNTSGGLADLLDTPVPTASPEAAVIDLEKEGHQIVTSQQPTITGLVPANVKVTISIHSETEIEQEVTADASGNFELDLSSLSQELEPGEHVIEYSYTDPTTGQVVNKTHTFTVSPSSSTTQLAQANITPSPTPRTTVTPTPTPSTYGTQYPYGSTTPTPTLTASQSASATASSSALKGGVATGSASKSALPVSGSINSTLTLIFGGLFFMIAGGWSLWVAKEIERD